MSGKTTKRTAIDNSGSYTIEPNADAENSILVSDTVNMVEDDEPRTGPSLKLAPSSSSTVKPSIFPTRRIVRLEPSPFTRVSLKIKRSTPRVNSAGFAVVDATTGEIQKQDVDLENTNQVPGTVRMLTPPLTPLGLKTGLNEIVDNPYSDEPVYNPAWGENVLKGKPNASLQNILEYKHNKAYNYYTNQLFDIVSESNKMAELPFFLRPISKMQLTGNVVFLNLDNPIDEVKYYWLRVHPSVANSYADLQDGKNPALWYMVDEDEVRDSNLERIRKETRVGKILEELNDSGNILIHMAKALECEDRSLENNKTKAYQWVYNFQQRGEGEYAALIKMYELYKDQARRERFFAYGVTQDLINYGILRYKEGKYFWLRPETDNTPMRHYEWMNRDKFVSDFILAPENYDEVKIMLAILASRRGH